MATSGSDMNGGMDAAFEAATAALRQSVNEAYQRGYEAAVKDMKARILASFEEPAATVQQEAAPKRPRPGRQRKSPDTRSRKGGASDAVRAAFELGVGKSITEIHQQALSLGHRLSIEGIGNELRRHKGEKYRRDERRHWFPLGLPETETAGPVHHDDDPAATYSNKETSDEAAIV
jgi:hypothetical protein